MSDIFSKNLKKQSARAKEKLLVSLGKADQTVDEGFDEAAVNFARQEKAAERLHKALRGYTTAVKAIGAASRGFQEALRETYEPEWPGGEHVKAMSQSLELLWDDYHDKLQDQALRPMAAHAAQFTELRAKMAKRGRKLTDYDHARHSAQAAAAKDESKQARAAEAVAVAQKMYDDLNRELLDELPALYDSRITFYVASMQAVANLQQTFHSETAKLARELCVQMDELGHALGRLRQPRTSTASLPSAIPATAALPPPKEKPIPPPTLTLNNNNGDQSESEKVEPAQVDKPVPAEQQKTVYPSLAPENGTSEEAAPVVKETGAEEAAKEKEDEDEKNPFAGDGDSEASSRRSSANPEPIPTLSQPPDVVVEKEERAESPASEPMEPETKAKKDEEDKVSTKEEAVKEQAPEVKVAEESGGKDKPVLYKVRATHRYAAEDSDELSFEAGELIEVLPFEDPEEQDEGWLFGRKSTDSVTGVFPANFTKPA